MPSPHAMPCPGAGKAWTVDRDGKPVCPRCRRALSTVAGKGRTVRDTPKVPPHDRPRSDNHKQ
ncbi:MAG: hypothetical protein HYZ39_17975 [Mycolicibacterium cosmeticum]|nr:hypothetical protein [Mycolicibacterium cosmeticum]